MGGDWHSNRDVGPGERPRSAHPFRHGRPAAPLRLHSHSLLAGDDLRAHAGRQIQGRMGSVAGDSEAVVTAIDDPRLRWINLPKNTGHQSGPNNEGLRQARGRLIAYLGHDDLWLPHHLALLVAALSKGADLAHGITALVHPDGRLQAYPFRFKFRPGRAIPPSSMVHRRTVTDAVGNWKPCTELREDPEVDLWRRAHLAGYRVGFVPRLTAAKFPATWRRDGYRTRACHEQAAWLRRLPEEAAPMGPGRVASRPPASAGARRSRNSRPQSSAGSSRRPSIARPCGTGHTSNCCGRWSPGPSVTSVTGYCTPRSTCRA